MAALVLLGSFLLAALPASPETERADYLAAKAQAGRSPEAHVKLALWCEAHGLPEERTKHLAIATLIDPKQATARGLMGLVPLGDRWVRPEKVGASLKGNANLAEYNVRRARLDQAFAASGKGRGHRASPARVWANIQLGLWCEQVGLSAEATAHFTTAVILDPRRKTAWQHLGYTRQTDGNWKTAQQLADARAEADAQKQADQIWEPKLEAWAKALNSPNGGAEAWAGFATVTDPRAVPAITRIFGHDGGSYHEVEVSILRRIDTPASSRALAEIAMSPDANSQVMAGAIEVLKTRSPRDFVGEFVEAIHSPLRYWVEPVRGTGSPGMLVVESAHCRMLRTYDAPPIFSSFGFFGYVGYDTNGLPLIDSGREERQLKSESLEERAQDLAALEMRTAKWIVSANLKAKASQMRLASDIGEIERINSTDEVRAGQIGSFLRTVFNAPTNLGVDEDAWHRWYFDKIGYSYTPPKFMMLEVNASPQPQSPTLMSCFVAGTLVRTLEGHRPIESLGTGEQVLSQDATTGALNFRPINFVHHNPPSATLRITMDSGETIVPSIYHRFWRVGQGWALARDLVVGETLRSLGGTVRVAEITPGTVVPVYNLDVAGDHSFFVGTGDTLVHDNTLPDVHIRPFDASTLAVANK